MPERLRPVVCLKLLLFTADEANTTGGQITMEVALTIMEVIDGKVYLKLYKGNAYVVARESSTSLYDEKLSSMHIEGGFDQQDSEGFIKTNAIRLKAHAAIMKTKREKKQ